MGKAFRVLSAAVFALALPVLLVTATARFAFGSAALYDYSIDTFGAVERSGISREELAKGVRALIEYFNSDAEPVEISVVKGGAVVPLFKGREVDHLRDVKALLRLTGTIQTIALGICLLYALATLAYFRRRGLGELGRAIVAGGAVTIAGLAAVGVSALADFQALFTRFHLLSFANDLWLLDPSRDYLVVLFPEGFWYTATLLLAGAVVTEALLALLVGAVLLRVGSPALATSPQRRHAPGKGVSG